METTSDKSSSPLFPGNILNKRLRISLKIFNLTRIQIGLSLVFLVVLPFVVFWRLWAPNPQDRLLMIGDILAGAYPSRYYIHELFNQGEWPLWNPYQLGGMPLLGDVQTAVYYLPNLLLDGLYRGQAIPYMAFEAAVIAHYAIAGLFFFAYLRNLKISIAAALLGAIAFEFNGFFIGHRGHYNMLGVVVWLPGVLWLLDCAWRSEVGWRTLVFAVLGGLTLSQMVMAGHPQLTFYCTILVVLYFIYRWLSARPTWSDWQVLRWRERFQHPFVQRPFVFGLAGILAGGLSAVAILPVAELLGRSLRSEPTFAFAAQFSLMPRNLISLFIPEFLNWSGVEFRIYGGLLTLALAAVAWFVSRSIRPEQQFFGTIIVLALIGSMGAFTAFHGFLYRFIPAYDGLRVTARLFFFANFGLAVLAAFGADLLFGQLQPPEERRLKRLISSFRWPILLVSLMIIALYLLLAWYYQPVGDAFNFYEQHFPLDRPLEIGEDSRFAFLTQITNGITLSFTLLLLVVTLLGLRLKNQLTGLTLRSAAIGLLILDLATFATYFDTYPADPETDTFHVKDFAVSVLTPLQAQEQELLLEQLRQLPPGLRIDNQAQIIIENYSQVFQVPLSTGYNILDLQTRVKLLVQWPYLDPTLKHNLLNVGYIFTDADVIEPPEAGASLFWESQRGKLWKRQTMPAYAYFSSQIRPVQDTLSVNGILTLEPTIYSDEPTIATDDGNLSEILSTYWPEAVAPGLFQIGQTEVQSPVSISAMAGGQNNYSAIIVDGITVTSQQRGIHIVVLDPISGQVIEQGAFDTYISAVASDQAAGVLDGAPNGAIVIIVTYDEGTTRLTDRFRQSLASLGTTETLQDRFGQAYALIGVKGAQPGTALESIGPEGRILDVGIPKYATPKPTFEYQVAVYRPNLITLAVQTDQPGLLTLSEPDYPGWSAFIDGTPVPIVRANGMLRAIFLPPNPDGLSRQVSFVYNPLSFRLGGAISIFTLLVSLGLLGSALLWRNR